MSTKKLTVKLLIDTKSSKVLFAEAGKDVVDFLLSLLGMPVGSIVKLLSKDRMVGCIANLYKSLKVIDATYLDPKLNRLAALNPVVSSPSFAQATLLLPAPTKPAKKYYTCAKYNNNKNNNNNICGYSNNTICICKGYYVSDGCTATCPTCNHRMTVAVSYVDPEDGTVGPHIEVADDGGFVKGVVTYTVMDDLTVTPMSTISSITLLNKLGVKDMSALQEKHVELRFDEGVELLKASLQMSNVLTHVFLGTK